MACKTPPLTDRQILLRASSRLIVNLTPRTEPGRQLEATWGKVSLTSRSYVSMGPRGSMRRQCQTFQKWTPSRCLVLGALTKNCSAKPFMWRPFLRAWQGAHEWTWDENSHNSDGSDACRPPIRSWEIFESLMAIQKVLLQNQLNAVISRQDRYLPGSHRYFSFFLALIPRPMAILVGVS